jgi:hypothetical protein
MAGSTPTLNVGLFPANFGYEYPCRVCLQRCKDAGTDYLVPALCCGDICEDILTGGFLHADAWVSLGYDSFDEAVSTYLSYHIWLRQVFRYFRWAFGSGSNLPAPFHPASLLPCKVIPLDRSLVTDLGFEFGNEKALIIHQFLCTGSGN